jgi:hypothetical protein
MAKKKSPIDLTPKYYVYYNRKTGNIVSVGNEKDPNLEDGIETTFDEVENLITGAWKFSDYIVNYKRQLDGTLKLAVIPNTDQGYIFKNSIFEWITEYNEKAECQVVWNGNKKCWDFSLSSAIKEVYSDALLAPKLVFFVTLETDFDFLVRTIFIETATLMTSEKVSIPFTTKIEHRSDKVSISSKLVFKTYGLKVINE